MRIWAILEELFNFNPIATLRYMKTKENRRNSDERVNQKIYDESYIQKKEAEK